MPIRYKVDVLQALKNSGYNTTRIRREKLFDEGTLQRFRDQEPVSWKTLENLCKLLNCQLGYLIEYTDKVDPKKNIKHFRSVKKRYITMSQNIVVTEEDRKKILESYYKNIKDIVKVFDAISEYQNNNPNNPYLKEYNKVRFCAYVFRIHEIPVETLADLTVDDIDRKNMVVKTQDKDVKIFPELFKYVDSAVQYATQNGMRKLITVKDKREFKSAIELKHMTSHFSEYCSDALYQISYKPTTIMSLIALRDSVKFEKVLKADTEIGLTHDYTSLKEALRLEFPPKNKDSNVYAKIASKYEMYIKWYKVFYETEEGQT